MHTQKASLYKLSSYVFGVSSLQKDHLGFSFCASLGKCFNVDLAHDCFRELLHQREVDNRPDVEIGQVVPVRLSKTVKNNNRDPNRPIIHFNTF